MAASSKPTAVHFWLAGCATTTVLLGIVLYINFGELKKARGEARDNADKAAQAEAAVSRLDEAMTALKRDLGYDNFAEIGVGDPPPEGTLRDALRKDLVQIGRDERQPSPQQPAVGPTLHSLRRALDSALAENSSLKAGLQQLESRLTQETTAHQNRAVELQKEQESSESELQKLIASQNEKLAEKDSEIAKWRTEARNFSVEKDNLAGELDRVRKQKDEEIAQLTSVVENLRMRLDEIEKPTFEKPDGTIVRVDNTTRRVWIDIGSIDNLRPQIGFSVYTQEHEGVGRNLDDIKGKIEVNKILGPNLAEARILDDRIDRPIHAGDPIYTPLWSAGLKEYFSFVGVIDLDGDGVSDREQLHDIIDHAGAGIEVEVDDNGERIPEGSVLTVNTKFLVIGKIENPLDFPGFEEKQDKVKKVQAEHQKLVSEALRQGIRAVNLRDFLAYIGYKPQRHLFIPGESKLLPTQSAKAGY